jgi:hypothetical protein
LSRPPASKPLEQVAHVLATHSEDQQRLLMQPVRDNPKGTDRVLAPFAILDLRASA